jgi:hypothetical protein
MPPKPRKARLAKLLAKHLAGNGAAIFAAMPERWRAARYARSRPGARARHCAAYRTGPPQKERRDQGRSVCKVSSIAEMRRGFTLALPRLQSALKTRFRQYSPYQILRIAGAGQSHVLRIATIGEVLRVGGVDTRRHAGGCPRRRGCILIGAPGRGDALGKCETSGQK